MKVKVLFIFAALLGISQIAAGQTLPAGIAPSANYTLGPGDEVTVKVLGEPQFDFIAIVDEKGEIEVPFVQKAITAKCRTEGELRGEVAKNLSVYLRNPQISLRVTDRKSRPPVAVYGEVMEAQRVILQRRATLLELLAFAGGVKQEKASGMVQVYRTRPALCSEEVALAWKNQDELGIIPTRSYSLGGLKTGGEEANPEIFPGDIIVVGKAPPVYVIGNVNALKEITIGENGLSLMEALSQAGGFAPRAKTKDIKIRRLKANSREREIIAVNADDIKKGKQKDVMLQAEDIVEVDKAPKSVLETVLELVTGTARSFTQVVPQRVMY